MNPVCKIFISAGYIMFISAVGASATLFLESMLNGNPGIIVGGAIGNIITNLYTRVVNSLDKVLEF